MTVATRELIEEALVQVLTVDAEGEGRLATFATHYPRIRCYENSRTSNKSKNHLL